MSKTVTDALGPDYHNGNTLEEITGVPESKNIVVAAEAVKESGDTDEIPVDVDAISETGRNKSISAPANIEPSQDTMASSSSTADGEEVDDEWLTKGFFISVTNDSVDSIYQGTYRPFLPVLEARGIRSLEEAKLTALSFHEKYKSESYTPFGEQLRSTIDEEHGQWLEKQLLGEVLKFQLQQEAMRNFFSSRDGPGSRTADAASNKNKVQIYSCTSDVLIVELCIVRAVISDLYQSIGKTGPIPAISSSYTLRLLYDRWTCSSVSSATLNSDGQILWDCSEITCEGTLTMESVRRGKDLRIELHDNSALASTLVASGTCHIQSLLNSGK